MARCIPAAATRAPEVADLIAGVSRRIRLAANRDLGPLGVTWGQVARPADARPVAARRCG